MGYRGWVATPNTDPLLQPPIEPKWFEDCYKELKEVSWHMMMCLRHKGCFHGDLGCDSGGWYLFEKIVDTVKNHWQSARWSKEIARIVYNLFPAYRDNDVARVIYYALHVQSTKHKVRNQGGWEQLGGVRTAHKLYAVRAVSGQSECSIHDPLRFAALAPISMKSHIAGLFHITEVEHLSSILSKGLVPGGEKEHKRKRADLCGFLTIRDRSFGEPRSDLVQEAESRTDKREDSLADFSRCRSCVGRASALRVKRVFPLRRRDRPSFSR